jgi:hypothetical protein
MTAIRLWFARWRELFLHFPLLFGTIIVAFYLIPAADPRSGIDGLGSLFPSLLTLLNAALAAFFAWVCQSTYGRELSDADEEALGDIAVGNTRTRRQAEESGDEHARLPFDGLLDRDERWRGVHALLFLLLDRATWFAVWLPTFYALQGLSH